MKRLGRVVLAALALALIGPASKMPAAPEPPVIELHRVAAASFFKPAKKSLLFALIIGSDVREGDPRGGRSDSLHLLAINTVKGGGTMIGIPRDSYVDVPGHGTDKINSSLFFGGPERTVETVSKLSGIPIQYWALIDFSRFRKLVDALGGVVVDVPYEMHDHFSGADFKAGRTKMNGAQALAFSRNRHAATNGDFGRSENQGRLLLAALEKFREDAKDPFSVAKYLRAFRTLVASNVEIGDLLDLVAVGRSLDPAKIKNIVVPGHAGSAGSASVVYITPGDLFARVKDDGLL
jgi:LCP family protein required for cell wall assembly